MSTIKHTIISWDCSFRNFFHLIDGILQQDFDLSQVEIIYVEQKTREFADAYNHKMGLRSLGDRLDKWDTEAPTLKVFYLDEAESDLYHLGRAVNKGLSEARGSIISVMDGDLLLPKNFLYSLESYMESGGRIANLHRVSASGPVGVCIEDWTKGIIDYSACLEICPKRYDPVPVVNANKGPMISARAEDWEKIGGYDTHLIWSTGLSRLGQDVDKRLCIATGTQSRSLRDAVAVHPYHPTGFSRSTLDSFRLLALQEDLILWSEQNNEACLETRTPITKRIFERNRGMVQRMHASSLGRPDKGFAKSSVAIGNSESLCKYYAQWRRVAKRIPVKYRIRG